MAKKLTMKDLQEQNNAQQVQIDNLCRIVRDGVKTCSGDVKQKDSEGNVSYNSVSRAADNIKDNR